MLEERLHLGDRSRGSFSRVLEFRYNRPCVGRVIVHRLKKVVVDHVELRADACGVEVKHEGYRTSMSRGSAEVKAKTIS